MKAVFTIRDASILARCMALIHANWARSNPPLIVTIEPEKTKRSRKQEKRHWAIMQQISERYVNPEGKRYDPETWHRYFCGMFIGKKDLPDGTFTYISSTTLDSAGYASFDTQIVAYAGQELGLTIIEMEVA